MTSATEPVPEFPTQASPMPATVDACLNCGAVPVGPWCHDCGQKSGPAHGSVLHLLAEFLETLTHADSRFWRTMRRLAFDPVRLTNDYLAGRRASEIPPLRLSFVMLFLLFGVGTLTNGPVDFHLPPEVQRQIPAELRKITIGHSASATYWLRGHLQKALEHPDEVLAVAGKWAERFAFLMLPIAAAILWMLFLPRRIFTLYDHMIFAIHSLSFASLVVIGSMLVNRLPSDRGGLLLLLLGLATTASFIALVMGLAVLALQLGARS